MDTFLGLAGLSLLALAAALAFGRVRRNQRHRDCPWCWTQDPNRLELPRGR